MILFISATEFTVIISFASDTAPHFVVLISIFDHEATNFGYISDFKSTHDKLLWLKI